LKEHRQEHQNIEESIFVLMASNPYKGEKQRCAYVDGVSEWVNMIGRIEQRKASGPDAGLKYYDPICR